MRRNFPLAFIVAFVGTALADPATPPAHPEKDFRAIGGGLFLGRDEELTTDDNGNLLINVYSRSPINAGGHYSLDLSPWLGIPLHQISLDAGSLGLLHMQMVTLDCVHRTYEVVDVRRVLPDFIWRPASTLPVLIPVFRYACAGTGSTTHGTTPPAPSAVELERERMVEEQAADVARAAAEAKAIAERQVTKDQAAARYEEMPAQYEQARKQSGYGRRFLASGLTQFPWGGKDGACSRLLVSSGWSKPLADVACHEQTVAECATNLTTESVSPKDMPLVSTVVASSTTEVCARVRSVTNPPRMPKP